MFKTITLRVITLAAVFLLIGPGIATAETITVATAASMKNAMTDIVHKFNAQNQHDQVKTIYGSSGKFTAQIQNGAPFDMLFSADTNFPQALKKEGLTSSDPVVYAIGRLVIWSSTTDASKLTLQKLDDSNIRKVAIANPDVAPYGLRAREAMKAAGVWEKLQSKLVLGENIEHAAQMASSAAADAAIIALSQARIPAMAKLGSYSMIDERLHASLQQAFVITQRARNSALARKFAAYVQTPESQKILESYGFVLPGKL